MTENIMTYRYFIALVLLMTIAIFSAGCTTTQSTPTSTTLPSEIFSSTDPSLPASYEEKYCLDVVKTDASEPTLTGENGGVKYYYPLITITAIIKSNCQYPVEGAVQLFAYDKNNKLIPGVFRNGIQDSQRVYIKPGQTKTILTTFDMRSVPNNPRDPDPNSYASFDVKAFVTHIISARDAMTWE